MKFTITVGELWLWRILAAVEIIRLGLWSMSL